jgi:hypothetical protein
MRPYSAYQYCILGETRPLSRTDHTASVQSGPYAADVKAIMREYDRDDSGRGLHSSTSQLNLSRFSHEIHPKRPLIPHNTPYHLLNTP